MTLPLGVILAGGKSTRMGGSDKALLTLGGQTLLARAAARLGPQVSGMAVSANGDPARYADVGLPVLADSVPGFPGPLAGVLAGLDWAAGKGERWDACLVGEPTNPDLLGDMVKIGRRGSVSGKVTVTGRQGHAAYPHLADNPVRGMVTLMGALMAPPFDAGTQDFQPSNLEVTSIDVGNPATNVIPAKATAIFNIRFNDTWTAESVMAEIHNRLDKAAEDFALRPGKDAPIAFEIDWADRPSHVFLTHDDALIVTLSGAVEAVTGRRPTLSTSGGTSDARFIKDYCPVVEFGLVGQTMHMVDERVPLSDLETLTRIYQRFIADWFAAKGAR